MKYKKMNQVIFFRQKGIGDAARSGNETSIDQSWIEKKWKKICF
jgi:hypothetical protein